jgi:pilus assembly protein FimV
MPPLTVANGTIDLDLDFSLDDAPVAVMAAADTQDLDGRSSEFDAPDLSFDAPDDIGTQLEVDRMATTPSTEPEMPDFELSFEETPEPSASKATQRIDTADIDDGMLSFDMGDLSLDLGGTPSTDEPVLDDIPTGDPLETKLSLAAEFLAIGDMEGARSLAEEVVDQATGALQAKASAFLADLG